MGCEGGLMINPELRNLLEDRIVIKATQRLRRHLTYTELISFFTKRRGKIESTHHQYIKDLDAIINDYLEELKSK